MKSTLALALRCYARYAVPLTLLSVLLFVPLIHHALTSETPASVGPATWTVRFAWIIGGTAWIAQFMLAGAAAPLARAMDGDRPSQIRALVMAVRGLIRAFVPVVLVTAAVVMGAIALVIPGVVLGVLLALTGTSTRGGLSEPMLDSATRVRREPKVMAIGIAAILVLDLAVVAIPFFVLLGPLPTKPTPDQLATSHQLVQIAAIGVAIVSPLPACLLAALARRSD